MRYIQIDVSFTLLYFEKKNASSSGIVWKDPPRSRHGTRPNQTYGKQPHFSLLYTHSRRRCDKQSANGKFDLS